MASFLLYRTQDLRQNASVGAQFTQIKQDSCQKHGDICKCTFCVPNEPFNCQWDESGDNSRGLCPSDTADTTTQSPAQSAAPTTTLCSQASDSSPACRDNNPINTACSNFPGVCRVVNTQLRDSAGRYYCACQPNQASLTLNMTCVRDQDCQSGYCNPTTDKCEDRGDAGGVGGTDDIPSGQNPENPTIVPAIQPIITTQTPLNCKSSFNEVCNTTRGWATNLQCNSLYNYLQCNAPPSRCINDGQVAQTRLACCSQNGYFSGSKSAYVCGSESEVESENIDSANCNYFDEGSNTTFEIRPGNPVYGISCGGRFCSPTQVPLVRCNNGTVELVSCQTRDSCISQVNDSYQSVKEQAELGVAIVSTPSQCSVPQTISSETQTVVDGHIVYSDCGKTGCDENQLRAYTCRNGILNPHACIDSEWCRQNTQAFNNCRTAPSDSIPNRIIQHNEPGVHGLCGRDGCPISQRKTFSCVNGQLQTSACINDVTCQNLDEVDTTITSITNTCEVAGTDNTCEVGSCYAYGKVEVANKTCSESKVCCMPAQEVLEIYDGDICPQTTQKCRCVIENQSPRLIEPNTMCRDESLIVTTQSEETVVSTRNCWELLHAPALSCYKYPVATASCPAGSFSNQYACYVAQIAAQGAAILYTSGTSSSGEPPISISPNPYCSILINGMCELLNKSCYPNTAGGRCVRNSDTVSCYRMVNVPPTQLSRCEYFQTTQQNCHDNHYTSESTCRYNTTTQNFRSASTGGSSSFIDCESNNPDPDGRLFSTSSVNVIPCNDQGTTKYICPADYQISADGSRCEADCLANQYRLDGTCVNIPNCDRTRMVDEEDSYTRQIPCLDGNTIKYQCLFGWLPDSNNHCVYDNPYN